MATCILGSAFIEVDFDRAPVAACVKDKMMIVAGIKRVSAAGLKSLVIKNSFQVDAGVPGFAHGMTMIRVLFAIV